MIKNIKYPQILGGVSFPPDVLNALAEDRLVIFAGAGVSMGPPSNLPSFWTLATQLAVGSGSSPATIGVDKHGKDIFEPLDQFLGRLPNQSNLRQETANKTNIGTRQNALHESLVRIYNNPMSARIVTTNYDLMFEHATLSLYPIQANVYSAPALPVGNQFNGIVHIHGSVDRPEGIVVTDSHFGEAYLTEGWARRFLLDVFQSEYTVLFVGYSHDDTMLRYLARALPVDSNTPRYSLISSNESQGKWSSLGIKTIPYKYDNNHTVLYSATHELANYANTKPSEWKYRFEKLAAHSPTEQASDENLVRSALTSATHMRFFTGTKVHDDWIQWLIDQDAFDALYTQEKPDEVAQEISDWLVKKMLSTSPTNVLLVLASKRKTIKPWFWQQLTIYVSALKNRTVFLRFCDILIHNLPSPVDSFLLRDLANRCAGFAAIPHFLKLFNILIEHHLVLETRIMISSTDEHESIVDAKLNETAETYVLQELYKILKIFRYSHAKKILCMAESTILDRRNTLLNWGNAEAASWDLESFRRSAIEPHEQDGNPNVVDIVIDMARDSLEWLAEQEPDTASQWVSKHETSESHLLRRLTIHSIGFMAGLSVDQKIELLLEKGLHDRIYRHEAHALLKSEYGEASAVTRDEVISTIQAFQFDASEAEDPEANSKQVQFNWLNELASAVPTCEKLNSAMNTIRAQYPDIEAAENTDLNNWSKFEMSSPSSSYSPKELLSDSGPSFDQILNIKFSKPFPFSKGPSKSGLEDAVSEAAKENSDWAFRFLEHLCSKQLWESDFTRILLRELSNWPEVNADAKKLLTVISNSNIQAHHPREVTDIILESVRKGGVSYFCHIVSTTDAVAKSIGETTKTDLSILSEEDTDPLHVSINSIVGRMAEYWLHALSHRINKCGSTGIDPISLEQLNKLSDAASSTARLSIPVLTQQLDFLNAVDTDWTKSRLIPLFSSENEATIKQAWSGYFSSHGPSHDLFPLLKPAFDHAIDNIDTIFPNETQSRFIEFLAAAVVWIVKDPHEQWLPKIINNIGESNCASFAEHLGRMIRKLEPTELEQAWEKWLKPYWVNRNSGTPKAIQHAEFNAMLHWLPNLDEKYPEGVKLLIQAAPNSILQGHAPLLALSRSGLIENHPNATAELVTGLVKCEYQKFYFYSLEEHVLAPLRAIRDQITNPTLTALNESLIGAGFAKI